MFHFTSLSDKSSKFVVPAYCGQMIWRISSYCLKIHGKNIYGTVDPYPDFPFLADDDEDEDEIRSFVHILFPLRRGNI